VLSLSPLSRPDLRSDDQCVSTVYMRTSHELVIVETEMFASY
jgi:hypothetical protein